LAAKNINSIFATLFSNENITDKTEFYYMLIFFTAIDHNITSIIAQRNKYHEKR